MGERSARRIADCLDDALAGSDYVLKNEVVRIDPVLIRCADRRNGLVDRERVRSRRKCRLKSRRGSHDGELEKRVVRSELKLRPGPDIRIERIGRDAIGSLQ